MFSVRFAPDGYGPGPATQQNWTIDTAPPVAVIDSAPSGVGNDRDATVTFHSTKPNDATFQCSLDGAALAPCSSPDRLTELADGSHTFDVWASDAAGNTQQNPTTATWSVGCSGGTARDIHADADTCAAAVSCPAGTQAKLTITPVVIAVARTAAACWTHGSDPDGTPIDVSSGPISLNGILLTPPTGTQIRVRLSNNFKQISLPAGVTWKLFSWLEWQVRGADTIDATKLQSGSAVMPAINKVFSLVGMPVEIQSPQFSDSDGGSVKFGVKLVLPDFLSSAVTPAPLPVTGTIPPKPLPVLPDNSPAAQGASVKLPLVDAKPVKTPEPEPAKPDSITVEGTIAVTNDSRPRVTGKVTLARAWLFHAASLKNFSVGFDSGPPFELNIGATWQTAALGFLPSSLAKSEIEVSLGFGEPGIIGYLNKLELNVSGIQAALGGPFFLQRLAAGLSSSTSPKGVQLVTVKGGVGVSVGTKLPVIDVEPVSLDGEAKFTFQPGIANSNNSKIEFSGTGKIFSIPVSNFMFAFCNTKVEFNGLLDLTAAGFGIRGSIENAWIDPTTFDIHNLSALKANFESRTEINFGPFWQASGEMVVSSKGWADCVGAGSSRYGLAQTWGQSPTVLGSSCDIGPYRASASQVGPASGFFVSPAQRLVALDLHGSGAGADGGVDPGAPRAVLTDPRGRSIAAAGPRSTGPVIVIPDERDHTTHVVLLGPAPGEWRIAAALGSTITSVDVASGLPPVSVAAQVSARGPRRTLRWQIDGQPGEQVQFTELGAHTSRVLLTTSRRSGAFAWGPVAGTDRARTILATMIENGLPRTELTVARFTAPKPARSNRQARRRRS
jgi:hypothetical protein